MVRAPVPALDDLVVRLVQAGIAVRELAPVVSPLEAAFLALTETAATSRTDDRDRRRRPRSPAPARRVSVARGYRFELVKLVSQWRIRLLVLACWLAPGALRRRGQPAELAARPTPSSAAGCTPTGWAGPLVVLGFSGTWALPLLTSLVAGDVFAAEDRLGTWRHLLVAVRSPRRIFVAKALASLTVILLLVAGLAVLERRRRAGRGRQPAAGRPRRPPARARRTPPARSCSPGSACSRRRWRSPRSACSARSRWAAPRWGCCCPRSLALALQLAQLLPLPVAVRLALPSYAFIAWHGLFTSPAQLGPLLIGIVVSLAWAVVATALAYLLFLRRDFTDLAYDGSGRRVARRGRAAAGRRWSPSPSRWSPARPPATGSGIEQAKVQRSLATAFAHLYRLQTEELHRPAVTEAQLQATRGLRQGRRPGRRRRGRATTGAASCPGTSPASTAAGPAIYQLDVTADGRYVADGDGPKEVNGYFLVRTPTGDAPNPLWQFDGNVDLLASTRRDNSMQVTRRRRRVEKARPGFSADASAAGYRLVRRAAPRSRRRRRGHRLRLDRRSSAPTRSARPPTRARSSPATSTSTRIGERLVINNGKIMSSSVSPDGTHLAASVTDGGMALAIVDLKNWKVQQLVGNAASANLRISGNDVGQEGPTYSPDGSQLWLGQTDGYTKFTVNADGTPRQPDVRSRSRRTGPSTRWSGEPVFSADGSTVYSAVNGQNRVVAIDAATGAIQQSWAVGNAPRDMVMVGNKLYVSNEGGRPAQARRHHDQLLRHPGAGRPGDRCHHHRHGQRHRPGEPGRRRREHRRRSAPDRAVRQERGAVRHQHRHQQRVGHRHRQQDKVVQTIATQPWPEASVGYEPDAVTLTDDGHLLVTLGRANAVAVYRYTSPLEPVSYVGLLPTDYFPAEITTVGNEVVVSNTRGIDARRPTDQPPGTAPTTRRRACAVHAAERQQIIKSYTAKVFQQNGWSNGRRSSRPRARATRSRCRSRRGSATPRRSSTSSCSSRRTGPTTRSSATSRRATATRRWRSSART